MSICSASALSRYLYKNVREKSDATVLTPCLDLDIGVWCGHGQGDMRRHEQTSHENKTMVDENPHIS